MKEENNLAPSLNLLRRKQPKLVVPASPLCRLNCPPRTHVIRIKKNHVYFVGPAWWVGSSKH